MLSNNIHAGFNIYISVNYKHISVSTSFHQFSQKKKKKKKRIRVARML